MSILFNKGDVYFGTCIEHCQTTKILCKRDVGHLTWSHFSNFLLSSQCIFSTNVIVSNFFPLNEGWRYVIFFIFLWMKHWPVEFNKVLS